MVVQLIVSGAKVVRHWSGISTNEPLPSTIKNPISCLLPRISQAQSRCRSIWFRPCIHFVTVVGFFSVRFPSITTIRSSVSMKTSGWVCPSKICQLIPFGLLRSKFNPSIIVSWEPAIQSLRFFILVGSELRLYGTGFLGWRISHESNATGGLSFFSLSPHPWSLIVNPQLCCSDTL